MKPSGARRTWSIKYRTPTGRQKFKSGFRTKSEANAELVKILADINAGKHVQRKLITFEEFAEQWLASRQIRGSTESGYGSVIRHQLIPRLGNIFVRDTDLRLERLQILVADMIEDELSVKSIHNVSTLLRTMLVGRRGASAMRLGYIGQDPTLGLELPTLEMREIVPPTPEQVWVLIDAAKVVGGIGYPIAFVDAFTGLRRNEVLSVRYPDVDWFNQELRIRTAISKQRATDRAHKWEWVVGPVKSKSSVRRVALTESVLRMLADLKGLATNPNGFIFPDPSGDFIDPDKFYSDVWVPITVRAGMAGTRFHDLRHFFASQLIAQGETAIHVRDQLGHSSIKVTLDTYGHLFPGAGKEAAARFENSMTKARLKVEATGSKSVAIEPNQPPRA